MIGKFSSLAWQGAGNGVQFVSKQLHARAGQLQERVSRCAQGILTGQALLLQPLCRWGSSAFEALCARSIRLIDQAQQIYQKVRQAIMRLFYSPPGPARCTGRELLLELVKVWPHELRYASADLKGDYEIVAAAVQTNGLALRHASEERKSDYKTVLLAVWENGSALKYASHALKEPMIVRNAIAQNGLALAYADPSFRYDRAIVWEAVRQDGLALQYASDSIKDDRQTVLAAVRQNPQALAYASQRLQEDSQIQQAANRTL